jgi:hypothetical protein
MAKDSAKYDQVNNIIRRSQALILNIQLLGADTTQAKTHLKTAKDALESENYDKAIDFAKKSMVEVMSLKKQMKTGEAPKSPKKDKPGPAPAAKSEPDVKDKGKAVESPPQAQATQETYESPDYYEVGFSYLIEENRANLCFEIFSKIVEKNTNQGLCICRINPMIIRKKYNYPEDSNMLWLTDRESSKEATISPSLESMIYVVEEFIDKNEQAVILLDGIEYLISNNGFNPVLRFIRRLIDKISETNTILLIGVGSKSINEQEIKLLERELTPIIIN